MVRATIFNCEIELSQLTRKGVVFSGSAADLRAMRAQFQRDHYIILPKLIEPDLLATILKRIESAPSVQKEDDGVVAESIIDDPHTYNLFLFLLNTPEFQRLVQRITGCHRIADFQGPIYRLNSTTGDRIVWHKDVYDHRMVTFSLNLTAQEYCSGTLRIRYRSSDEILHEVRNSGATRRSSHACCEQAIPSRPARRRGCPQDHLGRVVSL